MVFLILILQFVTCIFRGYKRGNSFPNHHCQDTVILLKMAKKKPKREKTKSTNLPNKLPQKKP